MGNSSRNKKAYVISKSLDSYHGEHSSGVPIHLVYVLKAGDYSVSSFGTREYAQLSRAR